MARTTALDVNTTMITTNGGKEVSTDIPTTAMVPARGKKIQDETENGEEIDGITLKIDDLTDANMTTGGGERIEN